MDKAEALSIVKEKLLPLGGLEPIDCPLKPTRTQYYVCYGIRPGEDVSVEQIDNALKGIFNLNSNWLFEYSATATYHDSRDQIDVGLVYSTLSKALGNDDLAPGFKKILSVFIEDNQYK